MESEWLPPQAPGSRPPPPVPSGTPPPPPPFEPEPPPPYEPQPPPFAPPRAPHGEPQGSPSEPQGPPSEPQGPPFEPPRPPQGEPQRPPSEPPPPPHGEPRPAVGPQPFEPSPHLPNNEAVTAIVCGLVAVGLLYWTNGLSSVLSLVLGIVAVPYARKAKRNVAEGRTARHKDMANAAYIIGLIAIALSLLATIGWILAIVLGDALDDGAAARLLR